MEYFSLLFTAMMTEEPSRLPSEDKKLILNQGILRTSEVLAMWLRNG